MQFRGICTCTRLQASQMQFGRILNKVLSIDRTKKSRYKEHPNAPHVALTQPTPFGAGAKKSANSHKNRRVTVLNKVFMKYITDLMATGEVASKLVGRGIEISHVKVAPDFRLVNVYWFAQNEEDANESTEQILKLTAGHLQHELSQLRVIGIVPPINFVKNKHYNAVKEVESRLSKVDFGEDFVPSAYITQVKTPVLHISLPPEIKAKVAQLESEENEVEVEDEEIDEELYENKIPEMKQNVMGFDHSYVLKKVKSSLNKSILAEKNRIINVPEAPRGSQPISDEVITFLDNREQKELFDDFLKKRLIEEKRKLKMIPLFEAKIQEEEEKLESMGDDCDIDELKIDEDDCKNDYQDLESHEK